MTVFYQLLSGVVAALGINELVALVQMLVSDDAVDMEIGQKGLQLAMLIVLIAIVESLKESFAHLSPRKERSEVPGTGDYDDEGDQDGGVSFFWLNVGVFMVLGTIAGVYFLKT